MNVLTGLISVEVKSHPKSMFFSLLWPVRLVVMRLERPDRFVARGANVEMALQADFVHRAGDGR